MSVPSFDFPPRYLGHEGYYTVFFHNRPMFSREREGDRERERMSLLLATVSRQRDRTSLSFCLHRIIVFIVEMWNVTSLFFFDLISDSLFFFPAHLSGTFEFIERFYVHRNYDNCIISRFVRVNHVRSFSFHTRARA